MTMYKPGQEWQRENNENVFLKMRVAELEAENEDLRQEIRDMQDAVENIIETIPDEDILDVEIVNEPLTRENLDAAVQLLNDRRRSYAQGMWHDPSGNEY